MKIITGIFFMAYCSFSCSLLPLFLTVLYLMIYNFPNPIQIQNTGGTFSDNNANNWESYYQKVQQVT